MVFITFSLLVRTLCSVLPISSTHVGKYSRFADSAFLTLTVCYIRGIKYIHGASVVFVRYRTLT